MTLASQIRDEVRGATAEAEALLMVVEERDLTDEEVVRARRAALRLKSEANRLDTLLTQLQNEMHDA